ncbi:MAG: hypothetical protein HY069_00280, partial [Chlamydiia bacterium]|nr:hypothetical protein [Chlamydiia bacterium]
MFRTLSRALLPNRFDQMLKRLVKKKGKRVLLFWNRGLGDIALGLYAMVHRIREFVPDAEITFLTRKNLVDGFQMLEGVKVVGADWQRSEKNPVDIDTSQYDLVIEKPDPTEWVRWQRGELVPKLQWEARYDALWKKFELPDGYTERDSKIGRCQGGAPILSQAKSASKP